MRATDAAILDVTTADLQTISPMNEGRFGHEAVALLDGRILLTGGGAVGGHGWSPSQSAEIYDPATATFTLIDQMSDGRHWHTTTLLPDGTVLVVGDRGDPTTYSAELFAPR